MTIGFTISCLPFLWAELLSSGTLVAQSLIFLHLFADFRKLSIKSLYLAFFVLIYRNSFSGGLDYYWLGLVKEGRIQKIDEKRWNAKMNTWCRAPGCVSSGVLIYANAVSGMAPHIPWPLKVILAGLSFMNGQVMQIASSLVSGNSSKCFYFSS